MYPAALAALAFLKGIPRLPGPVTGNLGLPLPLSAGLGTYFPERLSDGSTPATALASAGTFCSISRSNRLELPEIRYDWFRVKGSIFTAVTLKTELLHFCLFGPLPPSARLDFCLACRTTRHVPYLQRHQV